MSARARVRCVALLLAVWWGVPATAQDVWVGRPTIGDYVRRDMAAMVEAIQQARQASQAKKQFNGEIDKARQAFFATASTPEQRAGAEKRFADLLQQKDNHFLLIALAFGDAAAPQIKAFDWLTGGEMDGGIRPSARASFDRWVAGMRNSIGNTSTATEQTVAKALVENADLYARYQVERDKFEIDAFNQRRARAKSYAPIRAALEAARLPDGDYKLASKRIIPFHASQYLNTAHAGNATTHRQVAEMVHALGATGAPQLLECAYGPTAAPEKGASWTLVYENYRFWHHQVPAGLDAILALDPAAFSPGDRYEKNYLHYPMALDTCAETRETTDAMLRARPEALRASQPALPAARVEEQNRAQAQTESEQRRAQAQADAQQRQAQAQAQAAQRMADARAKMCARNTARIAQARQQVAAAPMERAPRMQMQLQAMERNHARNCGG